LAHIAAFVSSLNLPIKRDTGIATGKAEHPAGSPMNKSEKPNRWFAAWRKGERHQEDDPADMGTAFGLDLSLNLLHPEVETPRPAPVRTDWVKRLALRRKPAV
jgi:hypothetical protein